MGRRRAPATIRGTLRGKYRPFEFHVGTRGNLEG